ncbi:hypothetical protein KJ966_25750 [bacterium]|nr:hypothetical protein [bacterium]
MGDIHNLQIVISQSPLVNRIHGGSHHGAANGAQILNVIEQRETNRKMSSVRELDESEKTEKEEARKRRLKKASENQLIDLYR